MAAPQALNLSGWALPLVALLLGVLLGARLTERLPGAAKATLQRQPRQHRREGGDVGMQAGLPSKQAAPSQAEHERLQAHPDVLSSDAARFAQEFAAAPWLLPPRSAALPWAGQHDFDALLGLQSRAAGGHNKSVALLLFSREFAVMGQNSVYSLVKFGGVSNYIVLTWTPADLAACADLNLPCADVAPLLAEPLAGGGAPGSYWGGHDWLAIVWLKPAVLLHTLKLGYVVMVADVDVAYTAKPLWASYLAFMERATADGAFQQEDPVNTGQFVMLPTAASLAFAAKWLSLAPAMIARGEATQPAIRGMHAAGDLVACPSLCKCYRARRNITALGLQDRVPVLHTYYPSHFPYLQDTCAIGCPAWLPPLDPCDWRVAFVHPICTHSADVKEEVLRQAGFWFLDACEPHPDAASGVPACRPLQWRLPATEALHQGCPGGGRALGLVHGEEPPALNVVRAGLHGAAAAALMDSPYNASERAIWC